MKLSSTATSLYLCLSWAILIIAALWFKPLLSVAEQRYVSVAWEMWLQHQYLVPHLNGSPYADKPPLLFWLIQAGWYCWGVNDWWPRLLPSLLGLANSFLTWQLAKRLWPDAQLTQRLAPILLSGMVIWNIFLTAVMFDMLLTSCVLLALNGLASTGLQQKKTGWILFALGITLGILAKGPVTFLFTLPPALLAPYWLNNSNPIIQVPWSRWYGYLLLALLIAIALALAWVIPAVKAGGPYYREALLFNQTVGRLTNNTLIHNSHQHPIGWYLPQLPLWLLPFTILPWFWRACRSIQHYRHDQGLRFLSISLGVALIILCLVSGKQIYYLLPLIPLAALLFSRWLTAAPTATTYTLWPLALLFLFISIGFGLLQYLPPMQDDFLQVLQQQALSIAIPVFLLSCGTYCLKPQQLSTAVMSTSSAMILLFLITIYGKIRPLAPLMNVQPIANQIAHLQQMGYPVAYAGIYQGQFSFLGRLTQPLMIIKKDHVSQWAARYPNGWIVSEPRALTPPPSWTPATPMLPTVNKSFWQAKQLTALLPHLS